MLMDLLPDKGQELNLESDYEELMREYKEGYNVIDFNASENTT